MNRRLHIFVVLVFSIIGYSQQITGIVIEADSELPIPGATILLKDKSLGTNTDFDGKFTLNNVSDGDIITISSIGFISKEILIGSQINYIIELNEDVAKLEEVVVMGYGTQLKKEVTGAVSIVEDLNELVKFLEIDDNNLYNFYNGLKTNIEFKDNKINNLFKNFRY